MHVSEISVRDRGSRVRLTWGDGLVQVLTAAELRCGGRDASNVRRAVDGHPAAEPAPNLCITDVRLVGRYAVNICFSDGYDRAIYPWSYLRQLGDAGTMGPVAIT